MQNNASIWQAFKNFYKYHQEINLKDNPSLDELLTKTFLSINDLESEK